MKFDRRRSDEPRPEGFVSGSLGLTDGAFGLLRDLIASRTGVFYDENRRDLLLDRVAGLMAERGLTSLLDYYYLLKYDPDPTRAWAELRDRLAVPETYFWRQAEQFETLVKIIAPLYEKRSGGLRIWSAACCSGEEPLTIAMALDLAGWFDRMPIRIVGSDASAALVERARHGLFGERSMRNLSSDIVDRYFSREGNRWKISPEIHGRVTFTTANLMDEEEVAPLAAAADVVFCRNVLIYFSDAAIRQVAGNLAAHLPDDAFLFLGASESLMRIQTPFQMEEVGSSFVYRKAIKLPVRGRPFA